MSKRKNIVAGNWKMNLSSSEVLNFIQEFDEKSDTISNTTEVIIFPPSIYLDMVVNVPEYNLQSGAQNCSQYDNGAYTGEISATMLDSLSGITNRLNYCLVGHSERRTYYNETNEVLAQKVNQLLKNNLTPIYCCGEQLTEREANNHFKVIENQLTEGLFHLSPEQIEKTVIAYEPVWAIGTGVTASSDQAQEIHRFIRDLAEKKFGAEIADNLSILYGGSCKPTNAKELFSQPDIDGGLIGGASLKVDSFIELTNCF
jgi:triosephosphate isomerase